MRTCAFALLLLLAACRHAPAPEGGAAGCAEAFDPGRDSFPAKAEIRHAENLEVEYHRHHKVVRIRGRALAGEESSAAETLVLVQCGAPAPPLTGDLAAATVIRVPVRTVAATGVSDVKRIAVLGLAGRLVGIGGGAVYDPEIRRRWEAKEIATIGIPLHAEADFEALVDLKPDLTIFFTAGADRARALDRARSLGLTAVPSYAWSERTPLAQAEWIQYVALFFNAEAEAERFFRGVETRYQDLARRARSATPRPTVFWGAPADGDRWWVERSGPESILLADAGAVNLLADPSIGAWAGLDTGAVVDSVSRADFWITSDPSDREWRARVPLDVFKAYQTGRVFHFNKRSNPLHNSSDWRETGLTRPDLVLQDLVSLFHPRLAPGHQPRFFAPVELTQTKVAKR